ncbi:MAG: hypothetical protein KatS3mg105_0501 [Gemmatales bacterium]|nr:MAG: hypothetical protein KatS3mg105_0501 [Gemmatales bacterium]
MVVDPPRLPDWRMFRQHAVKVFGVFLLFATGVIRMTGTIGKC